MMGDWSAKPKWAPLSFLAELPPAARAELFALSRLRTVPAGSIVLFEGDRRDRHLVILEAGFVKVTTVAVGESVVLSVRGPGELLGEALVFGGPAREATVTAIGQLTYRTVSEREFTRLLDREASAYRALAASLSARLSWSNRRRAEARAIPALVRLARLLVDLGREYGQPIPAGLVIPFRLTQEDLAAMIGVSVAAVEKASRTLRDRGLLWSDQGRLRVIDLDGLRAFDDRVQ